MTSVHALGSGPRRWILEAVVGLGAVAIVSLLLYALDADQTAAALTLVVLGVALTFVGATAVIVGILASFASLNYFFTPPYRAFGIIKGDDLIALVALGITTGVLGATIARVNRLRHRSDLREQEIRARLDLSNRLAAGDDPDQVIADAEVVLHTIFGIVGCTLRIEPDGGLGLHIAEGEPPIDASDRSEIAAFVMGIGTALERVQLADEVQDARVEAAIEQSRASFLSAMTHNLRTPLATIKAAVSGLRQGVDLAPESAAELLDTAYSESDRLEQLVSKVLALSRIRAGAVAAHLEPVDLAEATQGAVQRLRLLADNRDIRLEAPADLPLVSADPALLDVALVNVLENALRYAPESAIEVRGRRAGDNVWIDVIDHGPGLSTADRARVFEEFVRVDPDPASPGTGIGLSIAKAFIDAQEGTIRIEETSGGGTTVTITLPVEEGTNR
jgi:two-component system sensor histidine kinase KdpD